MIIVQPKQAKNLFNAIIRDENKHNLWCGRAGKNFDKKDKNSSYGKGRTFLNINLKLEEKNVVGKKIFSL